MKKQEYERVKIEKNREINNLAATVEENKNRKVKLGDERSTYEMQNSKGSENLMSDAVYNKVVR